MNDKEQVINYLRSRGIEPNQKDIDFFCSRQSFEFGVVWACARINELHDQPIIANDVLEQADLSTSELALMPEYDLRFLRAENPLIPRGVD